MDKIIKERDNLYNALYNIIAVVDYNKINRIESNCSWEDAYIEAKIVLSEMEER